MLPIQFADTTCKKELTDEECLDNAGIMGEFFYKDEIQYTPIGRKLSLL